MDKKLLPKNFFRENPLDELSTANMAYLAMTAMKHDEFRDGMMELLSDNVEPERMERIEAEKIQIAQLKSGDETVKFIRSGYEIINREILCQKILTMQAEVIPPLLRRFRTSFQDSVVETAVNILSYAEQTYVDQLIEIYPDIRNPYAQSMACLVFGIQKREETLALLLREYERMEREYPEETFCEGPLLAIYILFGEV